MPEQEKLEAIYKNPEFAKAADELIGCIVRYKTGKGESTLKDDVLAVAVHILEERLK